jgi:hypothetical protein
MRKKGPTMLPRFESQGSLLISNPMDKRNNSISLSVLEIGDSN